MTCLFFSANSSTKKANRLTSVHDNYLRALSTTHHVLVILLYSRKSLSGSIMRRHHTVHARKITKTSRRLLQECLATRFYAPHCKILFSMTCSTCLISSIFPSRAFTRKQVPAYWKRPLHILVHLRLPTVLWFLKLL